MNEHAAEKKFELHDIYVAFSLLTRLPVPVDHTRAGKRGAAAAWAYPLVGLVIGAIAGCTALILQWVGIPNGMSIIAALGAMVLLTGGMHEDGFADFADGIGGGRDKEHALEIMKDSRIGAYGAIAICLSLLARWSGYMEISGWHLLGVFIGIGAASRTAMVIFMYAIPNAKTDGLSVQTGKPSRETIGLALIVATLPCLYFLGLTGIPVLIFTCLGALPVAWLAIRKIGGQTGDVLGAAQTVSEIVGVAALVAYCA